MKSPESKYRHNLQLFYAGVLKTEPEVPKHLTAPYNQHVVENMKESARRIVREVGKEYFTACKEYS